MELLGESWLKVDIPEDEQVWIDASHWASKKVWITDGYYKEILKKEWVGTSYTVNQGYWKTEEYRVWVNSSTLVPYTAYRWINTSRWERRYRYVSKWVPVNFTIYVGTSSYGWNVYSFASRRKQDCIIKYKNNRYKARKWVIDYRPVYGGRVYARKYLCYRKEVRVRESYNVMVSSGYWQSYTAYRTVDTSHWKTRTRRVWVDTSYTIPLSGYWRYYTEKEWVDTSHYEYRTVWIEDGYYTSPLHGEVTVEKNPKFIFTKWHKDKNNEECNMKLDLSWKIDNSGLPEGEEERKIVRIYIYEDIYRFNDEGIEKVIIFNDNISSSTKGSINTITRFDYSGSEDSILHIYLYTQSGESAHIYFSNPINGFRSINLNSQGSSSDANKWLGGNDYGKIEF